MDNKEKPEEIKLVETPAPGPETIGIATADIGLRSGFGGVGALDMETFITREREIKQAQTASPTSAIIPKEYKEQFYFKDDGTLWVNIANTWRQIGGLNVLIGTGQAPVSTGTQVITTTFAPKLITIRSLLESATTKCLCIGSATSTSDERYMIIYGIDVGWKVATTSGGTYVVNCLNSGGNTSACATISDWGALSVTLNWTNVNERPQYQYEIIG